jgi:hypothetical protein
MTILEGVVANVMEDYVDRKFIKDQIKEDDGNGGFTIRRGYKIQTPLVSSLSSNQRASREAPTIQVIADLAGAVHKSTVLVNLFV